ncbi:putative glycosyltransferase [Taylorella asinigenitalis 14/45]|uniref:Putative glycosyltransferase n=1 Tax=Taylorella asinigenitalis 14/45 TaxID=1091495 RepID=I7IBR9_9BURK|nr:sugar transferase [Taylorella asinigenitalis]CCG19279.1 putative glycosyltransferase [Taylorella asinigenitalis 14/45]
MYRIITKRILDIIGALVLLIFTSPVLLFITILLFFANNGKPFFIQSRPGKNKKIFKILKFKTMRDDFDERGNLLPDQKRLTVIGKFVRKTSLDELPQLINVLIGDMSFVGPRPLLIEYIPLYSKFQSRRHEVRPGITGWAQVNGRNAISWEEKFKLDVWYVDNYSLSLDIKILYLTFLKVLKSEGISSQGHVTTEKFRGTPDE